MKLKKCPKCKTYTLKPICRKCKTKTKSAHYKFVKIPKPNYSIHQIYSIYFKGTSDKS